MARRKIKRTAKKISVSSIPLEKIENNNKNKFLSFWGITPEEYWKSFRFIAIIIVVYFIGRVLFYTPFIFKTFDAYILALLPFGPFCEDIIKKMKPRRCISESEKQWIFVFLYLFSPIIILYYMLKYYFSKKR